jgi:hypothetical protein
MRSAGIDADGYKLQTSVYKYPEQCSITRARLMRNIYADVFIIFHSHMEMLPHIAVNAINRSRIIVVHTGTRFRKNSYTISRDCKDFRNVIALPEFAQYLPHADYVVGCIDDRKIQQAPAHGNRFGHYPSNPVVKGTETIIRVASKAEVSIDIDGERIPYAKHLNRVASADIIVEMHKPIQDGGFTYGSFGMQALEAAAMGKVVITNNVTGQDLYQKTYGDCELEIANTESELLNKLTTWKHGDTIQKGASTLKWYNEKHSIVATGRRWKQILRG